MIATMNRYRIPAFLVFFVSGTATLVLSILFAQTPSPGHFPDLMLFAGSTLQLLVCAVIAALIWRPWLLQPLPREFGPLSKTVLFVLPFELFVALLGVWGSLAHLHSL